MRFHQLPQSVALPVRHSLHPRNCKKFNTLTLYNNTVGNVNKKGTPLRAQARQKSGRAGAVHGARKSERSQMFRLTLGGEFTTMEYDVPTKNARDEFAGEGLPHETPVAVNTDACGNPVHGMREAD
jgi:hypothetical protein